jgi:hypothetical protein
MEPQMNPDRSQNKMDQLAEKHRLCLLMNFGTPRLEVRRIADDH